MTVATGPLDFSEYVISGARRDGILVARISRRYYRMLWRRFWARCTLTADLKRQRQVIHTLLGESMDTVLSGGGFKDYKTRLQEHYFKQGTRAILNYSVYKEEGPPHDKLFFVKLFIGGEGALLRAKADRKRWLNKRRHDKPFWPVVRKDAIEEEREYMLDFSKVETGGPGQIYDAMMDELTTSAAPTLS